MPAVEQQSWAETLAFERMLGCRPAELSARLGGLPLPPFDGPLDLGLAAVAAGGALAQSELRNIQMARIAEQKIAAIRREWYAAGSLARLQWARQYAMLLEKSGDIAARRAWLATSAAGATAADGAGRFGATLDDDDRAVWERLDREAKEEWRALTRLRAELSRACSWTLRMSGGGERSSSACRASAMEATKVAARRRWRRPTGRARCRR